MFFLYPYIKKMKGKKVGLIQEWHLFDILAFKVGSFFGGGHLLESELHLLPKMWQSEYQSPVHDTSLKLQTLIESK